MDEGETGIPEEQVRLDEVLAEAGDKLYYSYDSPGAGDGGADPAGSLPGPLGELVSAVRDSANGMLLVTSRGRRLRDDPAGLWWQLAERMPLRSADRCETQAGLLLLTLIAAGVPGDLDAVVARLLGAIGWTSGDGTQLTGSAAGAAAWDTRTVLRRLGGFRPGRHALGPGKPTPNGITFARAALRTWPS